MLFLLSGLAFAAEPNVQKGSFGLSYNLGQLSMSSSNSDVLMGGHYFLAPKKAIRASVGWTPVQMTSPLSGATAAISEAVPHGPCGSGWWSCCGL